MEVLDYLKNLSNMLNDFLMGAGIWAPILSSILIILEGTLAFLPLVVFVTINILTLGPFWGGLISWVLTILGSFVAFYLCRKGFSSYFQRKCEHKKVGKFINVINNMKFKQIVLIIAIPFAPSFFINVCAGLSKISPKKYFYALIIGKISQIIFLGYIGCNIIECLTNPILFIKIVLLMVGAYVIGQFVNKKFDLDERY